MRRDIGLILAGLGAFVIITAVALPTYIAPRVLKFPLNEYETATLQASNASYLSGKTLTVQTGVTMRATYTIRGDASAGSSSTAVWNEFSYVYDLTNHRQVQIATRRFAFDRKTADLVNCCGSNINGQVVKQSGIIGYVFPFGTKKQTYQVFDITLNKPMPFVYSGTATIHGIQTYKFVENVPPTQFVTLTVPGSFVGMSAPSVRAPEYDQIHLIYYVDPETGGLIDVNEHQTLTLHNPSTGAQALVLFDANLIATPASLNYIVGLDNDGRNKLNLIDTVLPLVLGIVGALLLVAGILLARRGARGDFEAAAATRVPNLAAVPEPAAEALPSGRAGLIPGLGDEAPEATSEPPAAYGEPEPRTASETTVVPETTAEASQPAANPKAGSR
jgi:Porin PorA